MSEVISEMEKRRKQINVTMMFAVKVLFKLFEAWEEPENN